MTGRRLREAGVPTMNLLKSSVFQLTSFLRSN